MKWNLIFATSLALGLVLLSPAMGQLELPDKPAPKKPSKGVSLGRKPSGDIVSGLKGRSKGSGLELPAPVPGANSAPEVDGQSAPTSAIEAVFLELAGERNANGELVLDAAASLVSMGAEGLAAARLNLGSDKPAVLVASARALLVGGTELDRKLVFDRASRRVPTRAAAPLLDAMLEATDGEQQLDLLFQFCDHRQGGMRRHAAKLLAKRKIGLGHLLGLAASKRSEARELAYQMMARLEDSDGAAVDAQLIGGLADRSTRVAAAACEGLAARLDGPGDPTVAELLGLARLRGLDDRRGAFALLTLIEAEDRLGEALVPFDESVNLLIHMRSGTPFVQATTATALAGIGFRSEGGAPWLDLEVPHTLVASVAGELYFPEYSVVRPAALRRLGMITGQRFGDEGPLWKTWWVDHARGFHALRAVLPVTLLDHARLEVSWTDPLAAESFRLLGQEAELGTDLFPGLTLRLSATDSEALMRELVELGVFGAERLPGLVGTANGVEAQLEVSVGPSSKAFLFGDGPEAAWAASLITSLRELRSGAEWQLYPSPEFKDAGLAAFLAAEGPWWSEHREPLERAQRLAGLIAAHMKLLSPLERGPAVAALERLEAGSMTRELFDSLADRLAEEQFFGDRARRLLALVLAAGRGTDGQLDDAAAGRLTDILLAGGDVREIQELAGVLTAASPAFQRGAAIDPRSSVRAVVATVLARRTLDVEDRALLEALLNDSFHEVEAAAVLAVSEAGLAEFREQVWARARAGVPIVRRAAIRGAGRLGGSRALDVLRLAVLDPDMTIKLAGAEALADLADPASVTLLTQMLASGRTGPFFEPAQRGLLAIGEPAWDALLILARNTTSPAQRPAMMILAEQEVTEVATILLTTLTEDPSDFKVARELAVLTGFDFRDRPNPAGDWWAWRDSVQGMDSTDWFCMAYNALVAGGRVPGVAAEGVKLDPGSLRGEGSLEGAAALVELLRADAPAHIVVRAVRELRRLLGQDLGSLPPPGRLRDEWCDVVLERLPDVFAMRQVPVLLEASEPDE